MAEQVGQVGPDDQALLNDQDDQRPSKMTNIARLPSLPSFALFNVLSSRHNVITVGGSSSRRRSSRRSSVFFASVHMCVCAPVGSRWWEGCPLNLEENRQEP